VLIYRSHTCCWNPTPTIIRLEFIKTKAKNGLVTDIFEVGCKVADWTVLLNI